MLNSLRPYRLLLLAFILLFAYAWQIEPDRLTVRRLVIRDTVLARAWTGLTILHLSDTHIEREGGREAHLLTLIKELQPDLILMSGDYGQENMSPKAAQYFLAQLAAPLGVYGVLGNTDQLLNRDGCAYCHPDAHYDERISRPVILRNERRELPWRGKTVAVAGIDADEEGVSLLKDLQARASRDHKPLLILSHKSHLWSEYPLAGHTLWLSGDTHGGQILLPDWFWKMVRYKPDPGHMGGLYGNGQGSWLLVNQGVGQAPWFPFRLGVPPEVVLITFAVE